MMLSDDGLSASVAAKGRSKDDDLGERGVPAGLQLGVVGDCGASHWTIGGRVWLGAIDAQSTKPPPSVRRWSLSGPESPWTAAAIGDGEERESRLPVGVSSLGGLGLSPPSSSRQRLYTAMGLLVLWPCLFDCLGGAFGGDAERETGSGNVASGRVLKIFS